MQLYFQIKSIALYDIPMGMHETDVYRLWKSSDYAEYAYKLGRKDDINIISGISTAILRI